MVTEALVALVVVTTNPLVLAAQVLLVPLVSVELMEVLAAQMLELAVRAAPVVLAEVVAQVDPAAIGVQQEAPALPEMLVRMDQPATPALTETPPTARQVLLAAVAAPATAALPAEQLATISAATPMSPSPITALSPGVPTNDHLFHRPRSHY